MAVDNLVLWGMIPRVLPAAWQMVRTRPDLAAYIPGSAVVYEYRRAALTGSRLLLLLSGEIHTEGEQWLHASFSYPARIPSYDDVYEVRRLFFPSDKTVLQIFPPREEHVNLHPYTLHLWCCLSHDSSSSSLILPGM